MERAWLVLGLLALTSAMSRRHRDATPYIDDDSHQLWSSEAVDLLEGEQVDSHLLEHHDPCQAHFCERGRVCRLDHMSEPQCECQPFCSRHRKLVCGTDGRLYLNHCELHRAACVTGAKIHIDRSRKCFRKAGLMPITWDNSPTPATPAPALEDDDDPALTQLNTLIRDDLTQGGGAVLTTRPPMEEEMEEEEATKMEMEQEANQEQDNKVVSGSPCTMQQYELLKDNLVVYHHARLMAEKGRGSEREYLVGLMFSKFDTNNNGVLDKLELEQVSQLEEVSRLAEDCTLVDLLRYDDANTDGHLNLNEFYTAFSVSVVSLDKALEVNHVSARVGDNLEIKCDVTGTPNPPIVWRRNGLDLAALNSEDIRVFTDGSLYLTRLQLVHAGNYTCHADRNKDVVQTHILTVHTVPTVQVTPHIQSLRPGEQAIMSCRATGEPFPKVEWLKNDEPLRVDIPHKYEVVGNGTQLRVRNIGYADTGAYMCQATSVGGMARDISSLIVQENPAPTGEQQESRVFVFHDWGVAVYEPDECRLFHVIQGTDVIPGTQEYVCGDKGTNCSWGRAINVAERYIYVTQPRRDRVLVVSVPQMVVVDVIVTDQFPVDLSYVPNLDQVWVLNWRSTKDEGVKTIQVINRVIRDASQKKKHHTVHPEPIDGHFDLVKNLFVPDTQDLGHDFRYGYVTHTNQRGLYKLDLANMKYVKTVDLTPYNCVPQHLVFSSLHGLVVMDCHEPVTGRRTGQLVLDYLTDAVLSHKPTLMGRPHVVPDSSLVVTVDILKHVKIVVQKVTDHGLDYVFDVITTLNVSDVTFFPSRLTHSYDLYAASSDKDDIFFLDLQTGKVEMITGVGKAMLPGLAEWSNTNRAIVSSGVFGHYMVSPAEAAIFVINGETRTVNCEIGSLVHPRLAVWITRKYM
ncbi:follistatin-related protein 5-like isoform X4 [Homarus americanus]|uniref:follistatin-related protein 5-like isoform X4 n=1 Tax=Homarus americanus TaxID=6706 RepID=UPI001C481CB9|nr:follistatin-related protein 5-like isoform X4 [Homarus americanus]